MTTSTETPEADAETAEAKRRGRPPGSKNKPKASPRRTTKAAATPRARVTSPVVAQSPVTHAVLIEDSGVSLLKADGTLINIDAPVFDRRTK